MYVHILYNQNKDLHTLYNYLRQILIYVFIAYNILWRHANYPLLLFAEKYLSMLICYTLKVISTYVELSNEIM